MSSVNFEVLNAKFTPSIAADIAANKPATAALGALYISTDTLLLERWNGSTWDSIGGGGGGITGGGTMNTIPIWDSASSINDSTIIYTPSSIGINQSYSFGSNTVLTTVFTGSPSQAVGFYIYEGVATGFNFQRVTGSPNYNSIYSGNSDLEFKLFDGATDYYHRMFKNGRVVINGTTDTGYQFRVNGTHYQNGNMTLFGTLVGNNTIQTGDGTIVVAMSYSASTAILGTSSNHSVDFRTNNTNAMRLTTSTNRLLINTTTDAGSYNLQVSGTSYFAGNIRPDSIANNRDIGGSTFAFNNVYSRNLVLGAAGTSQIKGGTFGDLAIVITTNNNVMIAGGNNSTTEISSLAALQFNNITTKGMLLPRLTTAQRTAISSPPNGLMVFDTDLSHICFYDTSGTAGWRKLSYSNA